MNLTDAVSKFNRAIPDLFHYTREDFGASENTFCTLVTENLNDPKFRNAAIDPDTNEVDLAWLAFLWWIFSDNDTRINDSMHGFFWSPSEDDKFSKILDENCHFRRLLADDIIVRAEYAKVKDSILHINWIFHKTQNLPNIIVYGRGNVPERLHGLRQARINVLNPSMNLPVKHMFADYGQRGRFQVVDPYEIFDGSNPKYRKMIGAQNVVIIDDYCTTLNKDELVRQILEASPLLTEHGRCLFDLPLYDHEEINRYSTIYQLVRPFIQRVTPKSKAITSLANVNAIDRYVHDVVREINHSIYFQENGYRFDIEEIKLIPANHENISESISARVYLKLSTHA